MPNQINEMIVRELSDAFKESEGMVICSLGGLTVRETEGLRNSLAERGVRLRMVRNRLARLALEANGLRAPAGVLEGNVAFVCGATEETILAAKVISRSDVKRQGKIVLRGGLLDGALFGPEEAVRMAELPTKDELRAQLLGVLAGNARQLVTVLNALPSSTVRVLQARIDAAGESA
jgi:large subunit ribosomal protein L10